MTFCWVLASKSCMNHCKALENDLKLAENNTFDLEIGFRRVIARSTGIFMKFQEKTTSVTFYHILVEKSCTNHQDTHESSNQHRIWVSRCRVETSRCKGATAPLRFPVASCDHKSRVSHSAFSPKASCAPSSFVLCTLRLLAEGSLRSVYTKQNCASGFSGKFCGIAH